MGNKMTSTRAFVDEKYTRPQGLYDFKDVDYRKLRRLILNGQLAPCFPGVEECTSELEECPICFLFYPSLNRSRCCSKAICTECYLQIKSVHFVRSAQCPFCKTSSYTVEFRGAKTAEEKSVEEAEEQKVIEAKIRIRQKELHDEAERVKRSAEDTQAEPFEHGGNNTLLEPGMSAQASHMQTTSNRTEGFDLDVEDKMLMEAISLSIQEQGPTHQESDQAQQIPTIRCTRRARRKRRARRAAAAVAERQATSAEIRGGNQVVNSTQNLLESDRSLIANHNDMPSCEYRDLATRSYTIDPSRRGFDANGVLQMENQDVERGNGEQSRRNASCGSEEQNSFLSSVQRDCRDLTFDLGLDQSSSVAVEAGTSFSSSIPSARELREAPNFHSSQSSNNIAGETRLSSASASMLPMSFEDQIMLAMALSLADAHAQGDID